MCHVYSQIFKWLHQFFIQIIALAKNWWLCTQLAASMCKICFRAAIYMRLAASGMQTLHALAASCVQSRQFIASTLREQLFE